MSYRASVEGTVVGRWAGDALILKTAMGAEGFTLTRQAYNKALPGSGDRVRLRLNYEQEVVSIAALSPAVPAPPPRRSAFSHVAPRGTSPDWRFG